MAAPWTSAAPSAGPSSPPERADVVVVGAGITGLAAALDVAEAGRAVTVLEDRHVGAGATGSSTAKVTVLHGTRLSALTRRHGPVVARRYAEAQQAGFDWLLRRAGDDGVERSTAFTHAADPAQLADVRASFDAALAAGVEARWVDAVDAPFPAVGAVAVDAQAQVDPGRLLGGLRARLEAAGGRVVDRCRVVGVRDGRQEATVRTSEGEVRADAVVVATGLPFLDRSLLFARTEPHASYCIGVRTRDALPDGMFLSAGSDRDVRSVRTAADPERPGERVLIVGGAGHKTGAVARTAERYAMLADWARCHWAVDDIPWRWSAEDFVADDGLPFVGPAWMPSHRVHVATGYGKWGFTNGAAAAMVIGAHLTDRPAPSWAADWDPRRLELRRGGAAFLRANVDVASKVIGGWAGRLVGRHRSRPVCTHLGGILRWNDGDGCWDCPLHGSRFADDGTLLHGPATRDLVATRRRDDRG